MDSVDDGTRIPQNTGWTVGESIRVRGDDWTIVERTAYAGCEALRLSRGGVTNAAVRTVLVPFDRPVRRQHRKNIHVVRPLRWLHAVRRAALAAHPFGGLSAMAQTGIQILPYQLEPALAMLRHGATHLLVADAVGLGKTIQAGILLNELAARQESCRALVVTPAGLRDQWCRELSTHFHLVATVADAAWLTQTTRDLPRDINPWILPGIYVTSFDFLKRPEVLRPLEELCWDALIVDEAHGAALGTARRAAVHAIGVRSRRVVLLTATPHPGDSSQFDALCRIGELDTRDGGPLLFRRSRADAGISAGRRSALLRVRLSEPERRMHRLLEAYTDRLWREALLRGDGRARLAAIVLRKRALSSASSLAESTRRRMALLGGSDAGAEHQLPLPMEEDDRVDDDSPDEVLGAPGLADTACEARWLAEIAGAAETAATQGESKLRFLLRLLARVREPAIVFTEYRDTLVRLRRAMADAGHDVVALHGGLSAGERALAQRAFNERGGLLLATDAAAEGLNLHGRCRTVVHYELPWSPVRLEQRVGRVDRIGQRRTVHEMLLVADDTAERLVLAPLARRAARARAAIPAASRVLELLAESRIASAVLEGRRVDGRATPDIQEDRPSHVTVPPSTLRSEAEAEADRLRMQRRWTTMSAQRPVCRRARAGGLAASIHVGRSSLGTRGVSEKGAHAPSLTGVYTLSLAADDGGIVHREMVAARIPLVVASVSRSRSAARSVLSDLIARYEPALRAVVSSETAARLRDLSDAHGRSIEALGRRERMMGNELSSAARQIVQAGLFDHREIRASAGRQRTASALLEETERRCGALLDVRHVVPAIELSAILLTEGRPEGRHYMSGRPARADRQR